MKTRPGASYIYRAVPTGQPNTYQIFMLNGCPGARLTTNATQPSGLIIARNRTPTDGLTDNFIIDIYEDKGGFQFKVASDPAQGGWYAATIKGGQSKPSDPVDMNTEWPVHFQPWGKNGKPSIGGPDWDEWSFWKVLPAKPPTPQQGQLSQTLTPYIPFKFNTPQISSFTIPSGISKITAKLWGAGGGKSAGGYRTGSLSLPMSPVNAIFRFPTSTITEAAPKIWPAY